MVRWQAPGRGAGEKIRGNNLNLHMTSKEDRMRKLVLASVICLSVPLAWAGEGKYQPLNVKTGSWETTNVTTITGAPPIPQDMLDRMTPEQRARFQAAMSRMASGTPRTRTYKTCATKEDMEKDPFNDKDKSCVETVLTSTGSRMEIHEVCTMEDAKVDAKVRIEAVDSENVKGWAQSTVTGGGRTMNANSTFTSKWLGAVCTDQH
jgi:Protein of unknown function (DUF3617)